MALTYAMLYSFIHKVADGKTAKFFWLQNLSVIFVFSSHWPSLCLNLIKSLKLHLSKIKPINDTTKKIAFLRKNPRCQI
jgi:hypothetical protein